MFVIYLVEEYVLPNCVAAGISWWYTLCLCIYREFFWSGTELYSAICSWMSDVQIVWAGHLLEAESIHRPIRLFLYWKSFNKLLKCFVLWSFGSLTPCSLVSGHHHFGGIYSYIFKVQLYVPLKQRCRSYRQHIVIIQKVTICIFTRLKTWYLINSYTYVKFFKELLSQFFVLGSDLIFSKSVLLHSHYKCYCSWWWTLLSRTCCITYSLPTFYLCSTVVFFYHHFAVQWVSPCVPKYIVEWNKKLVTWPVYSYRGWWISIVKCCNTTVKHNLCTLYTLLWQHVST